MSSHRLRTYTAKLAESQSPLPPQQNRSEYNRNQNQHIFRSIQWEGKRKQVKSWHHADENVIVSSQFSLPPCSGVLWNVPKDHHFNVLLCMFQSTERDSPSEIKLIILAEMRQLVKECAQYSLDLPYRSKHVIVAAMRLIMWMHVKGTLRYNWISC